MRVMKFGGTSVGSAVQIRKVAGLIGNKSPKIVVLSAMSGTTNTLVEIAGTLKDGDRFRFGELVGQLELNMWKQSMTCLVRRVAAGWLWMG